MTRLQCARWSRAVLLWALALPAPACRSSDPAGVADRDGAVDASDGGAGDPVDTGPDDAVATLETLEPDGLPDVAEDGLPGQIGDACNEDGDCESFLCADLVVGDDSDGLCTYACVEDENCPAGFDCVFVTSSGGDVEQLCLPVDLCIDNDDDGFGVGPGCEGTDCDDNDNRARAGFDEVCDDIDNDCDEAVDDNPIDEGDDCETGFDGVCADGRTTCIEGFIDCASRVGPTSETCDGQDNDCDSATDEASDDGDVPLQRDCYDGDLGLVGHGVCRTGLQTCTEGGFSACLDQVLPAAEMCDDIDNDCDDMVDEDLARVEWWPDGDGDGFGNGEGISIVDCARPTGHVEDRTDCDDEDANVNPVAPEMVGDELDSDCDDGEQCYADRDADDYRTDEPILSVNAGCRDPGEAAEWVPAGDCNDFDGSVHPGAVEIPNDGCDNDCDGADACYADADGDRHANCEVVVPSADPDCLDPGEAVSDFPCDDCDDTDPSTFLDASEACDAVDNDCDGRADDCAGCLALEEDCIEDCDCAADFCFREVCSDPRGCNRRGSCPARAGLASGGGRIENATYTIELTVGLPASTVDTRNDDYAISVGVGIYRTSP